MAITHAASFAGGPIVQALLTAEKAITVTLDNSEEAACIIEVRDQELKEEVSSLVHQLCATLLLKKQGGVV